MPNMGAAELLVILILAMVIFGPKRLPSAARSLGGGMREFKEAVTGRDDRPGLPGAQESDAGSAAVPEGLRESAEA